MVFYYCFTISERWCWPNISLYNILNIFSNFICLSFYNRKFYNGRKNFIFFTIFFYRIVYKFIIYRKNFRKNLRVWLRNVPIKSDSKSDFLFINKWNSNHYNILNKKSEKSKIKLTNWNLKSRDVKIGVWNPKQKKQKCEYIVLLTETWKNIKLEKACQKFDFTNRTLNIENLKNKS